MKKFLSLILVLTLVFATAAPAMALSSSMTYKTAPSGTLNGFGYNTETGASTRKVTAYLHYDKTANLGVRIDAETYNTALGTFAGALLENEYATDISVSESVSAGSGVEIRKAYVYYSISSTALPTVTMS